MCPVVATCSLCRNLNKYRPIQKSLPCLTLFCWCWTTKTPRHKDSQCGRSKQVIRWSRLSILARVSTFTSHDQEPLLLSFHIRFPSVAMRTGLRTRPGLRAQTQRGTEPVRYSTTAGQSYPVSKD